MRHPPTAQGEAARTTNDFFLGGVKIQPNFESTKIEDQVLNIVGGTGAMHIQLCYKPQQVKYW
jgi:serum/glucocorticoid-regulated kinase 2